MSSSAADPPGAAINNVIDLRLLSQSDIYKLSLSTRSPSSSADLPIPQINRSIFNESAASHKQTYSLSAPRDSITSFPLNKTSPSDPETAEDSRIISILKGLIGGESSDVAVEVPESRADVLVVVGEKRKPEQPRQNPNPNSSLGTKGNPNLNTNPNPNSGENGNNVGNLERDRERLNEKGMEVDLGELAVSEDPFRGELERRTVALRTEKEFLGFLRGLNGKWGSKRRKRRVVDASEFGDVLPRGWKLILSLKKKDERIWVHVRRYISPSGRHFVTCKEVATYLHHIFGLEVADRSPFQQTNNNDQSTEGAANLHAAVPAISVQLTKGLANAHMCCYAADPAVNVQSKRGTNAAELEHVSPSVVNCVPDAKQITSVISYSADIQAENILTCENCCLSFNGRDDLMKHKLLSHRRKKSKFGSSIADGVIIGDGLYECQFCHTTFVERHHCNGHVGVHKSHNSMNNEGSLVVSLPSSVDVGSPKQNDSMEPIVQASIGNDSDSATANYGTHGQPKLNMPYNALLDGSDKDFPSDGPYNEVNNVCHNEQEATSIKHAQCLAKSDVDHKVGSSPGCVDQGTHLAAVVCTSSELELGVPMPVDKTNPSGPQKSFETSKISINMRNIAPMELERPKIDKIPTYRSNENAFSVSHQMLTPEVRRPEFGLPFLSDSQQFCGGENTSSFNSMPPQASTVNDSNSVTAIYGIDRQPKLKLIYNELNNISHDEQETKSIKHIQCLTKSDVDHNVGSSLGSNVQDAHLAAAIFCTSLELEDPMPTDETNPIGDLVANKNDDCIASLSSPDNTPTADVIVSEVPVTVVDLSLQANSEISSFAVEANDNACNADNDVPINLPLEGSSLLTKPNLKSFSESTDEVMFGFKDIRGFVLNPETDTAHNCENNMKTGDEKSMSCLNIAPLADKLGYTMDRGRRDFVCTTGASGPEKSFEIGKVSIDVRNIAPMEPERSKIDNIPTCRSNENVFSISHRMLTPEVRRPEFGLPFLSGNQQFFVGENTSGFNSVLSNQKNTVDNSFRTDNCLGNSFSDVYTMNNVMNSATEPKARASLSPENNKLMIDFGKNGSGRESHQTWEEFGTNLLGPSYYSKPGSSENYIDWIDVGWDGPIDGPTDFRHYKPMTGFGNSDAQSHGDLMTQNFRKTDEKNQHEIDRRKESSQTWEESKQEMNLLGPSYCSNQRSSKNYFDCNDTGSFWDGHILDGATDFGHDKPMTGFSNSSALSHGDLADNLWTDERNTFQDNLAAPENQQEGSSSFLPDTMPDKDDDIFLGVNGCNKLLQNMRNSASILIQEMPRLCV